MVKNLAPSQAPLYIRLKETIRELCQTLGPEAKLPSEAELERIYDVSRTTVRLAVGALVNEGLVIARQGKGSFVASPKRAAVFHPGLLKGSQDEPSAILSFETVPAGPIRGKQLGVGPDALVHKIRRSVRIDGVPLCYQVSYLPAEAFPDLNELDVLPLVGKYEAGTTVTGQSIEIVLADAFRAEHLQVLENSPLLLCEQIVDLKGIPVELVRSFYGGHSVKIHF